MICPPLPIMAIFLCLQASESSLKRRGTPSQGCLLSIFTQNKLLCLLVWACIWCTMCMRTARQMVEYTKYFRSTFLSQMAMTYNWGWYQCKYTSGCHILISESQYPVHTRALTIPLWFLVRWASSPPLWVSWSWCLYFNNFAGITKCWTYLEEGACIPDYVNLVTNLQIL